MKACPFCAEPIQDAAVKCRYCGEWLDPNRRPPWSNELDGIAKRLTSLGIGGDAASPPTPPPAPRTEDTFERRRTEMMPGLSSVTGDVSDRAAPEVRSTRPGWLPNAPQGGFGSEVAEEVEPPRPPPPFEEPESATIPPPPPPRPSLEEVAQRMGRLKATAAVVRSSLEEHHGSASQRAAFDPAEPARVMPAFGVDAPRPRGEAVHERTPAFSSPSLAGLPRAPAAGADSFSDAFFGDASTSAHGEDGHDVAEVMAPRAAPWGLIAGAVLGVVIGTAVLYAVLGSDTEVPAEPAAVAEAPARVASLPAPAPAVVPPPVVAPAPAPVPVDPAAGLPSAPPPPTASPVPNPGMKALLAEGETPAAPAASPELRAKLEEARTQYKKQRLAAARTLLQEILAAAPTHPDALLLLAQVQLEEGQFDQALQSASRCTEVAASLADCWLTLGVLRQNRQQSAEAVAAYERYLALAPNGTYARDAQSQIRRLSR